MRISFSVPLIIFMAISAQAYGDPLGETPQEIQAVVHLDREEFPTARTLAEKSLATKDSFMATFVMGAVHALGGRRGRPRGRPEPPDGFPGPHELKEEVHQRTQGPFWPSWPPIGPSAMVGRWSLLALPIR